MPKGLNIKNFTRRRSSGNALDLEPEAPAPPAQSSFRVIERPEKRAHVFQQNTPQPSALSRPTKSLLHRSVDDLSQQRQDKPVYSTTGEPIWQPKSARGSGGTTNSGSTGRSPSESARYSSTSTLPSSLEHERDTENEELFPPKKSATSPMPQNSGNFADAPLPPPPSFKSRAMRTFSFGQKNGASKELPAVPAAHIIPAPAQPPRSQSPYRERALTASSYASTAVPPKAELTLSTDDFGNDDFSDMFDGIRSRPAQPSSRSSYHRTDSEPMFPPRTHSRQAFTPSPNQLKVVRDDSGSPFSWDRRSSHEGLMDDTTPSSPLGGGNEPAVPAHGSRFGLLGLAKSGYAPVPERHGSPDGRRSSYDSQAEEVLHTPEPEYPNRQTHVDDRNRWVDQTQRIEFRDPQGPSATSAFYGKQGSLPSATTNSSKPSTSGQATAGASSGRGSSPLRLGGSASLADTDSGNTTPRAAPLEHRGLGKESMFDASPSGPASQAIRPTIQHQRNQSNGGPKKMTKAQFQILQKHGESSADQSAGEGDSDDGYDDEDDIERAKKLATQRRKAEANMSVYRQQMKKVTGGGPADLPRPPFDRGASAPAVAGGSALHFGGIGGTPPADSQRSHITEEDFDDVPLGILQAHGFPNQNRPPARVGGENEISHQRRPSGAGSVIMGGGAGTGPLPAFARGLPADPYFGAGLVNQSTRESLAMHSSGVSVIGGPSPSMMGTTRMPSMQSHPGGLVGVIAQEEQARAARRGSPTAAMLGVQQNMPLPPGMNMPQMPRTMSMGNVTAPRVYSPSGQPLMPQMGGMPGMPMDSNQQQMQQFMQMQMQLMQNMMQMQSQMGQVGLQTPQPQQAQAQDYLGVNFGNNGPRPTSMASQVSAYQLQPPTAQGRAMTMTYPPTGWNGGPNGSHQARPNSAMPMVGSYAPSTAGGGLQAPQAPGYAPSLAPSERSNVGMPTRYRPVGEASADGRSQSMTSSLTLQAFTQQQTAPNLAGTGFNGQQTAGNAAKNTIRVVKGGARVQPQQKGEEEESEGGWAEMRKKRGGKKGGGKEAEQQRELGELYHSLD